MEDVHSGKHSSKVPIISIASAGPLSGMEIHPNGEQENSILAWLY
jgi:hypothetical protein